MQTTSESIISDMDTTNTVLEQQDDGPDSKSECHDNYGGVQPLSSQLHIHDSHIFSYLIKKTCEIAEYLLKDWSVRKTVILAIIFITLYQLCTTLIHTLHTLQVDEVII